MLNDTVGKTSGEESLQGPSLISDPQTLRNLPQSNPLTLKIAAKRPHEMSKHNDITQCKTPQTILQATPATKTADLDYKMLFFVSYFYFPRVALGHSIDILLLLPFLVPYKSLKIT